MTQAKLKLFWLYRNHNITSRHVQMAFRRIMAPLHMCVTHCCSSRDSSGLYSEQDSSTSMLRVSSSSSSTCNPRLFGVDLRGENKAGCGSVFMPHSSVVWGAWPETGSVCIPEEQSHSNINKQYNDELVITKAKRPARLTTCYIMSLTLALYCCLLSIYPMNYKFIEQNKGKVITMGNICHFGCVTESYSI